MKKIGILVLILSVVNAVFGETPKPVEKIEKAAAVKGTISVSGAWALYPLVVKWAAEFKKVNPDVQIDVSAGGAGKGIADALAGVVDLGMVSRDLKPEEIKKGAWDIAVTKDAVVPVVNQRNKRIKELLEKGLTRDEFIKLWIAGEDKPFHVYTRSDACGAAETWAKFLGKKQEDLKGIAVFGDPGLASAVKKDPKGIGYNNVNFVYDARTHKPLEGLKVLPIDLNKNGKIDKDENFYGTQEELIKAILDGKYPSPPARDLLLVSHGKPQKPQVVAFLKWILADGQKYVTETGYIKFSDKKLKDQQAKLGK